MDKDEAIRTAHALAKKNKQPSAVYVRLYPGGSEGSCEVTSAWAEKPSGPNLSRLELVMIVSVTGVERKIGRWA